MPSAASIAAISSVPPRIPADPVSTILTGLGAELEVHPRIPTVIRLIAPPTYGTIANAISSPPATWALSNSAGLASASSTSAGLVMTHLGTGGTDMVYGGVATAPYYSRSVDVLAPRPILCRVKGVVDVTGDVVRFGYMSTAGTIVATMDIYNSATVRQLRYIVNGTTFAVFATPSQADCAAGFWFAFMPDPASGYIRLLYNTTTSATPPTTGWTHVFSVILTSTIQNWIEFQNVAREATGAAVGTFAYWSNEPLWGPFPVGVLGATGLVAASSAIPIIASGDFGVAVTPSITLARLRVADMINRLGGDAATATVSITGSASANPSAATTYQSAATVVLKNAGSDTAASSAYRCWSVRIKFVSTSSLQPGSLTLPGFFLEV